MMVLPDLLEGFIVCLQVIMMSSSCKKAMTDSDGSLCMEEWSGDNQVDSEQRSYQMTVE